jgi:hypothetical protein
VFKMHIRLFIFFLLLAQCCAVLLGIKIAQVIIGD